MTIDEAIKALKEAKKAGHKSAVFAWWFADMFGRKDDKVWEADAEYIEEEMDWSSTHERIEYLLEMRDEEDPVDEEDEDNE